ncbi:hypothetical protein C8A00DRAFT_11522 [Chaetomidium leptoderma]|uniref:Uncharacterized protein n=1 Tax=Chaetomidium leptoderma TaxID=669021 RepID=A0AAN6VU44_9PEZI|nr:hypothetical protein C8A00DRAFT_11522 [Chaetomidium leptoderma]
MRIPPQLFLALASWPTTVLSKEVSVTHNHVLDIEIEPPEGLDLAVSARYPLPGPRCDNWVGIEVIYMVEVTEVCPDGSTVAETVTECVETLTRSICATATTNRPCYPCVMGTPPSSDTATVTMTSCSTATEQTVTVTVQLCSTCTATIYIGTVPGYTPGGACHGCAPYGSGSLPSSSSCSEGGTAVSATTTTTATTSASTSVAGTPGCTESEPGNPGVSSSGTHTTTTAATHKPTTAPPVVTAGGAQNAAINLAVLVMGWAVVCVVLGM